MGHLTLSHYYLCYDNGLILIQDYIKHTLVIMNVIIVIAIALVLSIQPLWRRYTLWRWKHHLNLNKHLSALKHISEDLNGFHLSKLARTNSDAMEYVYGEIDCLSFIALLSLTNPNQDTVFYDLGSGLGKTVLACAMIFNIKKSCGIELFSTLDTAAKQQLNQLKKLKPYQSMTERVVFICGNFMTTNFDDATHIYINATGYFGETWDILNTCLEQLPTTPIIITTTKPLKSGPFQIVRQTRAQMSWGIVDAFIQIKAGH